MWLRNTFPFFQKYARFFLRVVKCAACCLAVSICHIKWAHIFRFCNDTLNSTIRSCFSSMPNDHVNFIFKCLVYDRNWSSWIIFSNDILTTIFEFFVPFSHILITDCGFTINILHLSINCNKHSVFIHEKTDYRSVFWLGGNTWGRWHGYTNATPELLMRLL